MIELPDSKLKPGGNGVSAVNVYEPVPPFTPRLLLNPLIPPSCVMPRLGPELKFSRVWVGPETLKVMLLTTTLPNVSEA